MWPKRNMNGFMLTMIFVLLTGIFLFASVMDSAAADDQAKQIERKLSSVKRGIATSPSRAETEWMEAREMLTQLQGSDPSHAKIPTLQKTLDQLGTKLEKRLGRPIGGSKPEVTAKQPVAKQKSVAAGLPSSVTSRMQKIDSALDAVETALEKNQMQTAERRLQTAENTMQEIESRYSDKIPEGDTEFKAVADRLAAVTGKFNQARAAADETAAAEAEQKKQKENQSREWIAKFSPFLDPKSDSYLLMGSSFNSASKEKQETCRQAYDRANALMAEYQKTEFPYGKTQELVFMEPSISDRLKIYNDTEAGNRQQESCQEWVDKLRAYVDVGAGSRKYLVTGVTVSEEDIKEREALYKEAQAVWSDYQKAEFPLGKTPKLVQLEEDMQERLDEMPEVLRKSRSLLAGDLEGELDRIQAYLDKDTGWKSDTSKTPNIAMKRDVEPLHKALERYAGTVDAGDAKLAVLKEKIALIEKTDQKNRAIRAERTFMEPDRYQGSDAEELRNKVNQIVAEKSSNILRITLRAEDWKQEEVVEWTDTTRTVLRHRITKSMTAQAAAKGKDGKVYLHSVHLASDRQSGGWGPLYGHIMWSDWMAEENVNK